jgi:hypothetical protein
VLRHNFQASRRLSGSGVPRNFFGVGGSTNSVEDRGQRERRSGGGSPLVRGSAQFANELNPYSYYVVTDVFSTEQGIWLGLVKTLEFRGGGFQPPPRNPPPPGTPLLSGQTVSRYGTRSTTRSTLCPTSEISEPTDAAEELLQLVHPCMSYRHTTYKSRNTI